MQKQVIYLLLISVRSTRGCKKYSDVLSVRKFKSATEKTQGST